jgi:hypothetical protein
MTRASSPDFRPPPPRRGTAWRRPGVAVEGGAQAVAGQDLGAHAGQQLAQAFGFGLLDEGREGLLDGEAGGEQGGPLAGEQGEVGVPQLAAGGLVAAAVLGHRGDFEGNSPRSRSRPRAALPVSASRTPAVSLPAGSTAR